EAFNSSDEEYGDARQAAYLEIRSGETLKELVSGLIESVLAFCGSERPRDDMTLMAVSRVPV
ncbi:MAG: SpoIIE family protein phosphatase, partial [Vicinamibacteria bacterium]